jgi:predicted transcriptional regulator
VPHQLFRRQHLHIKQHGAVRYYQSNLTKIEINSALLGRVYQQKTCNVRTQLLEQNCNTVNRLGGHCYICEEDLCNRAW